MAPHDFNEDGPDEVDGAEEQLGEGAFVELARLPERTVITLDELARIFGKHSISIRRAIERGELPEPVRLMGKPVWTVGHLLNFVEERLRAAKSELEVFERHRPASGL